MTQTICPLCGGRPEQPGAWKCPADGAFYVSQADRERYPNDALLGRLLDKRYPILGVLGGGAMGRVYRSFHTLLNQDVALKVIHATIGMEHEEARERFLREARVIASLRHPNIVALVDLGQLSGGTLFLVMERVLGLSLGEAIVRGRLSVRQLLHVALQILEGLDHIHSRDLVHRDIKPDNVMLVGEEWGPGEIPEVKLLDFGVVKLAEQTGLLALTRENLSPGTPKYMAPEQLRAEPVDGRADLYALGTILYKALAGREPFLGKDLIDLASRKLHGKPEPLKARGPLTRDLVRIVMKALAKRPEDRYASAGAMARAIEGCKAWSDTRLPPWPEKSAPSPSPAASPQPAPAASPQPVPANPLAESTSVPKNPGGGAPFPELSPDRPALGYDPLEEEATIQLGGFVQDPAAFLKAAGHDWGRPPGQSAVQAAPPLPQDIGARDTVLLPSPLVVEVEEPESLDSLPEETLPMPQRGTLQGSRSPIRILLILLLGLCLLGGGFLTAHLLMSG